MLCYCGCSESPWAVGRNWFLMEIAVYLLRESRYSQPKIHREAPGTVTTDRHWLTRTDF